MFCRRCGSEIKPGLKFCGRCGVQVTPTPQQPRSPTAVTPAAAATKDATIATPVAEGRPAEVETSTSEASLKPSEQQPVATPAESPAPMEESRSHALLWIVLSTLAAIAVAGAVYFFGFRGEFSDADIVQNVKAALFDDANLRKCTIDVTAQNGIVTLVGLVNSDADKANAVRLASETRGVSKIIDQLSVQVGNATAAPPASQAAPAPAHAPKQSKEPKGVGTASEEDANQTTSPPVFLSKPKPHTTEAPLPIQIGDFSMAMKQCTWTENNAPYVMLCEGTMVNKSDIKLDMTFRSGSVIDDKANQYTLSTASFLLGYPGIMFLGSAATPQELMPNLPIKFGFEMLKISRDATALNLILKFSTSGSPSDSEVVFKDIPIRVQ